MPLSQESRANSHVEGEDTNFLAAMTISPELPAHQPRVNQFNDSHQQWLRSGSASNETTTSTSQVHSSKDCTQQLLVHIHCANTSPFQPTAVPACN